MTRPASTPASPPTSNGSATRTPPPAHRPGRPARTPQEGRHRGADPADARRQPPEDLRMIEDFDVASDWHVAAPYEFLGPLRREQPVFRSEHLGAYVLTRHADVRAAYGDRQSTRLNSSH